MRKLIQVATDRLTLLIRAFLTGASRFYLAPSHFGKEGFGLEFKYICACLVEIYSGVFLSFLLSCAIFAIVGIAISG